jgi:hypothetical protein
MKRTILTALILGCVLLPASDHAYPFHPGYGLFYHGYGLGGMWNSPKIGPRQFTAVNPSLLLNLSGSATANTHLSPYTPYLLHNISRTVSSAYAGSALYYQGDYANILMKRLGVGW